MEGDAPPEGGPGYPVNEALPPESGGSGTEFNTFNDTPSNTTHGTLQSRAESGEESCAAGPARSRQ
eukprot:6120777-Prymnesium_polylepis.1